MAVPTAAFVIVAVEVRLCVVAVEVQSVIATVEVRLCDVAVGVQNPDVIGPNYAEGVLSSLAKKDGFDVEGALDFEGQMLAGRCSEARNSEAHGLGSWQAEEPCGLPQHADLYLEICVLAPTALVVLKPFRPLQVRVALSLVEACDLRFAVV